MAAFVELLGPKLLSKDGEVDTATALTGKSVGLYFSAHWCPPCRGFTPGLAKSYTSDLKAKGMEIVFVSSDQDESGFQSYYAEMPWLALPYSARDKKEQLSSKFQVKGIPSLTILDSEGKKITSDGRNMVSKDPKGENFPMGWAGSSVGQDPMKTAWEATHPEAVPKGKTMEFAEKQAKPIRLMAPIMEKTMLAGAIPGVIELMAGLHFAMSPCGITILVKWLLADGLLVSISSVYRFFLTKKGLEVHGSTDLQAYLIHKERDGTVDQDMEAQLEAANEKHSVSMALTYALLCLGFYLYSVTTSEGCNEAPSSVLFYVLMLRLLMPCLVPCVTVPSIVLSLWANQ